MNTQLMLINLEQNMAVRVMADQAADLLADHIDAFSSSAVNVVIAAPDGVAVLVSSLPRGLMRAVPGRYSESVFSPIEGSLDGATFRSIDLDQCRQLPARAIRQAMLRSKLGLRF